MRGKIKFYNENRGFGFIVPDEGGNDVFFHVSNVTNQETLKENDAVEFEVMQGDRGPQAQNIKLL